MTRVIPLLPDAAFETVEIDGVTYRPPLIDSDSRVYVNTKAPGASEVKNLVAQTPTPSTTRATILTPTSGKKARIIACHVHVRTSVDTRFEVYFGTGATILMNADKAILYPVLDTDAGQTFGMTWPDGAGPVGDVNEVVSVRTSGDITTDGSVVLQYREES